MIEDTRIKVFLTVVRLGSFTAAARELDVTQPSVSQNIAELERQLGAVLLNRSRSQVQLTPQGETFLLFARRIAKNYEDLNAVFADYEAFSNVAKTASELSSDPLFEIFKSML